jgi:hypothetical protein
MKNAAIRYLYVIFFTLLLAVPVPAVLSAGTVPTLEILSPYNGESVGVGDEVVVAISIFDEDGDVDIPSIKMELNSVDVTEQANTSAFLVTFPVPDTTVTGRQTINLTVRDLEGNVAVHDSYFNILPEPRTQPRVTYNGTVGIGAEYDREAPQSAIGNLTVDLFGSFSPTIDYALSIDATNRESSDGQRVSDFRFDLFSPIGALVLGDATPQFTDYTIDGRRVTGFHVLPQFGWFGFEVVWGQTYRAVEDDNPSGLADTFKQTLFGTRLKFGRPQGFLWGLSFLKVKDDKDSIDYLPDPVDPTKNVDSPTPKDNVVLGTDIGFGFKDNRIRFDTELNASLLNEDISGGAATADDFALGVDPSSIEWLFTINEYVRPLRPGWTNIGSKVGLSIGPFAENTFYGEYSYIGPTYFSLANPALINDRQGFLLRDSIWLLNRALFLNASFQRYTDNLQKTKTYTTANSGISGSAFIYPTPFLSINAGVDVAAVKNDAPVGDIEAVNSLNTTINTGIAQDVEVLASATNVYFTFTASLFNDRNVSTNDSNLYTTRVGAISFFNFPLDTRAILGYDFGDPENSVYVEGYVGYRFLRERTLYPYLGASYQSGAEQLDLNTGIEYDITRDAKITASVQYLTSPVVDDLFVSAFANYNF